MKQSLFDDTYMSSGVKMVGRLQIELRDEHGELKDYRDIDNLVVTVGKTYMASRCVGTAAAVVGWMALGTNTTAAAVGDTALGTLLGAYVALTSFTNAANVVTAVCSFGPGVCTGAITEAGTFNASSAGTMLGHVVFSVINKAAGDTMTVTWTTTFS